MRKKVKWTKVVLAISTLLFAGVLALYAATNAGIVNNAPIQTEAVAGQTPIAASFDLTWLTPLAALVGIIYVVLAARHVMKQDEGSDKVKKISKSIREGAYAYLKQQYSVVGIFFVVLFLILVYLAFFAQGPTRGHLLTPYVPFAFITGGFFSGLCGFIGMWMATNANARTAWAAKKGLNPGLRVAFTAGSVMGMIVVSLGLLDLSLWFYGLRFLAHEGVKEITEAMLTFGMGASSMALFARVGGGIYTKSADVGSDIVGKVEAGIPEDDPRNPATIADNVGDNVGDVAGMGADLYESYVGSIVATMALGAVAFPQNPLMGVTVPMALASLGVFASLIGTFLVSTKDDNASQKTLLGALRRGVYSSSGIILILSAVLVYFVLGPSNMGIFWSIATGLIVGNVIGFATEYFTSASYKPTQKLAMQAKTGPATLVISGIALGMLSTWVSVIAVVVGVVLSYFFAGGFSTDANAVSKGLYGISTAAIGMLSTLGITLSTDAYGPVADNAGGIAEMAGDEGGLGSEVRKRTDALDSLGNTTAATGKGYAIGSAALTALALLAAFQDEIFRLTGIRVITDIVTPEAIIGLFLGAMAPFLFSSMTMSAVGRAANAMVEEVRRQFREIKGILEGKAEPDYKKCVAISTAGAQKEMILPSLMAVIFPVVVGSLFGMRSLIGFLAGALVTGFPLAIMMANAGGAWDNAKKYIEEGNLGGKGSEAHKAGVVGDTVGDPFKDTSGPAMNILIKLMTMVSVVFGSAMLAMNRLFGIFKF